MKLTTSFLLTCMMIASSHFITDAQDAKTNIKAAYDLLNKRDYAAFAKHCAPDFIEYSAGPVPITTAEAAIEAYKEYFAAFPDLTLTVNEITKGENGKYYIHVTSSGTNNG